MTFLTALSTTKLPKLKHTPGFTNYWGQLPGSSDALVLAQTAIQLNNPLLVICSQSSQIQRLERELKLFLPDDMPLLSFPDWETLPYDYFSPHETIVSERLKCLHQLPKLERGIVVTALSSAATRLSPKSFIDGNVFFFKVGLTMDLTTARSTFERAGYRCVDKVMEHGEFAVRGSLLDLYPMGSKLPIRIDFFDEEIETIREFDTESQLSSEHITEFNLLPAHEFATDNAAITQFRQLFRQQFDVEIKDCPIYQDVSNGLLPAGIEYYLPLFNSSTETLFDYLPSNALIVSDEHLQTSQTNQWEELNKRYDDRRWDRTRPILSPENISLPADEFNSKIKLFAQLNLSHGNSKFENFPFTLPPNLAINHKAKDPLAELRQFAQKTHAPIIICAESAGRREAILELFKRHQMPVQSVEFQIALATNKEDIASDNLVLVSVAPIDQSFCFEEFALIAETELFGQHVLQRRRRQNNRNYDADAAVHSLAELKPGDPVVHVDHGVGRYLGLQCIEVNGQPAEYLTLEYSGNDKLYVPVQALHLIHRYSGASESSAPWHKLGNEQWAKERKKAAEKVRDVAAELLDLYAIRASKPGFKYETEDTDYFKFADGFPFELTPDQDNTVNALLADMKSSSPMDRLVCGDVGFGKTEVAMRAAFIATQNCRQVAVLVPTTLLAQQHYENFKDRFADWPIQVDLLSRFRTQKETNEVLAKVKQGKVDIVIGTHKLIQGQVEFDNLGLVVIDEEHRFGVRQKEKFKALRSEVDVLTLTATPIPRTLNMSLSGMRDLSIIATPPAKRLAIKTFVREYNKPLIKEAIQRETMRGGQVYFLHNNVESIERRAKELQELIPEIQVGVAHGQMRERELEQIMQQFYHQRFHVLLCTTIIETGIDVPNANTIIMERADKLGLAQLHQLRGRVGRSHHQAYAYLLTPSPKAMTRDAVKRLDAISSLEDLGAGFSLATHDMEIRGAGEILGDDQSGQMESIGFSLYLEMLEQSVAALKEGKEPSLEDTLKQHAEIDLGIPALIPESYIPDVHTRLVIYKQIANASNADKLRDVQVSLIDRFGLLPEHLKTLVKTTELKLTITPMGIKKLTANDRGLMVEFEPTTSVDPGKIINLIQKNPSRYRLEKGTILRVIQPLEETSEKWREVESLIETLNS